MSVLHYKYEPFFYYAVVLRNNVKSVNVERFRIFRVDKEFAVHCGKWYFEFEAVTDGEMKVGWARPGCKPDVDLGSDNQAFVFDGSEVRCHLVSSIFKNKAQ